MNNISVFLEHIYEAAEQKGLALRDVLSHAASCGISHLECDWQRLADGELKPLLDRCGLGVSCIYRQFDFLGDSAEISAEKCRGLFETARHYGCDKVLCIPGFSDAPQADLPRFAEGMRLMCGIAEEYGITVTVEDFDDIKSPCCRAEWLNSLLEEVPALRYTFDTGNFRYCLEDAGEAYRLLKKRVVHVHCKDRSYDPSASSPDGSNGKADLSGAVMYPAVVGEGVIGIEALVRELLSDGYAGTLAIEHFGALNQWEYMKKSAENLRGYMQK